MSKFYDIYAKEGGSWMKKGMGEESQPNLIEKTITKNGTYKASDEGFNGTITWDGNTEGLTGFGYWYKVSDKVLTKADFLGASLTLSVDEDGTSTIEIDTEALHVQDGFLMDDDAIIISAVAGTYETEGDTWEIPEDGTYFMDCTMMDITDYTLALTLPNAPIEVVDGFSSVVVNVETKLVELSETYNTNGTFEIEVPSHIIEWDGDTTGLEVYDTVTDGKYYKVSDRTFTLEELNKTNVELSSLLDNGSPYMTTTISFSDISTDMDSGYMYAWEGWIYVINGIKDGVEYAGTYFFGSTDEYVSKLTLPNAKADGISKVDLTIDVPTYITVATEDEALDETAIPIVEGQIIIVEG